MLRIIFDTNIYSFIAKDRNVEEIRERIKINKDLRVYGYRLIKEEIKNIPRLQGHEARRYRALLIRLYFDLIREQYPETLNIKVLAKDYYKEFKRLSGNRSFEDLRIDFEIVACAAIHNLDLIISDDEKTLKGDIALSL